MEIGIFQGLQIVFQPINIFYSFIGVFVGTIVGVLPGLGCVGAMALLFPLTLGISAEGALIMLCGIYYGAMYGGSTTSILLNIPGEAASVVTAIDGFKMTQAGRAGAALSIAAIGSFIAGTLGVLGLQLVAVRLAELAIKVGPMEYFSIALVGLIILSNITSGSILKSWCMILFGLSLSTIGIDIFSGGSRFSFGTAFLERGVGLVPVVMGVYGVSEILFMCEEQLQKALISKVHFRDLVPNSIEIKRSTPAVFRGSVLGFLMGLIPGPTAIISSFASYALEKKVGRFRHELGSGAIEGVAGPESANNSATAGAMVPLLSIGLPFNAATAMLLGAFMVHGVIPGPLLAREHPAILWSVIASLYLGNFFLLVLNLPFVGLFINLLKIPKNYMIGVLIILTTLGSYSVNNNVADIGIMVLFGVFGYGMRKSGFDPAPLVIAMVIGPMLEDSLRQSLLMSQGDVFCFFRRPASCLLLISAAASTLLWQILLLKRMKSRRN
jgi:putative tricarboxylic transport membrane protein